MLILLEKSFSQGSIVTWGSMWLNTPYFCQSIRTQHPDFERLMMARKNGVGQIIEAGIAVVALIALTCRFRIIKAALDDLGGLTRWTCHAVWPAQLADGLIAPHIINEIRDIDLHRWTPVRGWELRCHQYRTSSNSTTLESNKSEQRIKRFFYRLSILHSRTTAFFSTDHHKLHAARFARLHELTDLFCESFEDVKTGLVLGVNHFNRIVCVQPSPKRQELGNLLVTNGVSF